MKQPHLCMNQYFILNIKLILHYILPNVPDNTVEPMLTTIFSHWPASFLAPANSSYTRSCFNTFCISHLSRTVKATKVGVKRSQML